MREGRHHRLRHPGPGSGRKRATDDIADKRLPRALVEVSQTVENAARYPASPGPSRSARAPTELRPAYDDVCGSTPLSAVVPAHHLAVADVPGSLPILSLNCSDRLCSAMLLFIIMFLVTSVPHAAPALVGDLPAAARDADGQARLPGGRPRPGLRLVPEVQSARAVALRRRRSPRPRPGRARCLRSSSWPSPNAVLGTAARLFVRAFATDEFQAVQFMPRSPPADPALRPLRRA